MPDFRAYCQPAESAPREIRLTPAESHHLVTVNRCARGDAVVAFDGQGREWLCACADPSRSATVLQVKETRPPAARPHEITLGQALPKGSVMEEIVRQATEIGAAQIVPLLSERTQVHLDADRADKKTEKWRATAIEAAKQCGNPWLPRIAAMQALDDFVTTAAGFDLKLIASLHAGTQTLKAVLAGYAANHEAPPRRILWLVGPEGDFSPPEMTAAITHGFKPVTLGPLVLRTDTAACFALSILAYELQAG